MAKKIQILFYQVLLTLILRNIQKSLQQRKNFDAILEKIPDNDSYQVEHQEGKNPFRIEKDKKKGEKDEIDKVIEAID